MTSSIEVPANIHSVPFDSVEDAYTQLRQGSYVPKSGHVNLCFINGWGISYYSLSLREFIELDDDNFIEPFKMYSLKVSEAVITKDGLFVDFVDQNGRLVRVKRFIFDALHKDLNSIHNSEMPL